MSSARRPRPHPGPRGTRGPRGPLPPGVYWRRRLFVLGVAFSLVFVIARWLTAGSDGSSADAADAKRTGAQVPATQTVTAGASGGPSGAASGDPSGATAPVAPTTPTLAAPEGECSASDVVVTPSVATGAVAGGDVPVSLSLQTLSSEACNWQVDSRSVTVRISQNGKVVWTTGQCPKMVPTQPVVVRRAVATVVQMSWNARESTSGCTAQAKWVMPGGFTVEAASLGGEPAEADFSLGRPVAKTIEVPPPSTPVKQPKKPKTPTN
ncbi:hypothetical protein GCM10022237_14980 [Nocardioides ginsengisoli]|uniref:DUF4232 domain-containing protein n=1 Tax=Nocardioides ginsengisoli TaxID=363868 RepID=A0ABW3W0T6_9ACTN